MTSLTLNHDMMTDDEVTASDVPPGCLFFTSIVTSLCELQVCLTELLIRYCWAVVFVDNDAVI